MLIGDLQRFLSSLAGFMSAHQGPNSSADLDLLVKGLEPFQSMDMTVFLQLIMKAGEIDATQFMPVKATKAKKPASPRSVKPKLLTKDDVEEIAGAASKLNELYGRATDPSLAYEEVEQEVQAINDRFDFNGLKAVANHFDITSGLKSKKAVRDKIEEKIKERKRRNERNQVISEAYSPPPEVGDNAAPSNPKNI